MSGKERGETGGTTTIDETTQSKEREGDENSKNKIYGSNFADISSGDDNDGKR